MERQINNWLSTYYNKHYDIYYITQVLFIRINDFFEKNMLTLKYKKKNFRNLIVEFLFDHSSPKSKKITAKYSINIDDYSDYLSAFIGDIDDLFYEIEQFIRRSGAPILNVYRDEASGAFFDLIIDAIEIPMTRIDDNNEDSSTEYINIHDYE